MGVFKNWEIEEAGLDKERRVEGTGGGEPGKEVAAEEIELSEADCSWIGEREELELKDPDSADDSPKRGTGDNRGGVRCPGCSRGERGRAGRQGIQ